MGEKAVILLSGGLDSCTCMAVAHAAGYELYPISFDYHQRHDRELECAKRIAAHYHAAEHLIIETNMDAVGGSALTDDAIDVPEGDAERTEIPVTYVPARNLIFLSYALGYAERVGAAHLYIGVNSVDYSGYPDCRPEFIAAFQGAADAATAAATERGRRIVVETPISAVFSWLYLLFGSFLLLFLTIVIWYCFLLLLLSGQFKKTKYLKVLEKEKEYRNQ